MKYIKQFENNNLITDALFSINRERKNSYYQKKESDYYRKYLSDVIHNYPEMINMPSEKYGYENGMTPIFIAIDFNDYDSVKLLIDNGADVNVQSTGYGCIPCAGTTPIMWNSTKPGDQDIRIKIDKLLYNSGANIFLKNEKGLNFMHYIKKRLDWKNNFTTYLFDKYSIYIDAENYNL